MTRSVLANGVANTAPARARLRLAGDFLTTGQAADFCCVSDHTVKKWCGWGLPHDRLPGAADSSRRIRACDLASWLPANGMRPPSALLALVPVVLWVGAAPAADVAPLCRHAGDALSAARLAALWPPAAAVVEAAEVGRGPGLELVRHLASLPNAPRVAVVLTEDAAGDAADWTAAGAARTLLPAAPGWARGLAAALLGAGVE